jgi:hypothetical protein
MIIDRMKLRIGQSQYSLCVGLALMVLAGSGWAYGSSSSAPNDKSPGPASISRVVYAHYMHCFVLGYMAPEYTYFIPSSKGDDDLEHWPRDESMYTNFWPENLASSCQNGDVSLQKDFDLGLSAGLDAFGLLTGPGKLDGKFGPGEVAMFRLAAKNPVKILPELWQNPHPDRSSEDMAEQFATFGAQLKKVMDQYPDGVLRIDGKPALLLARLDLDACRSLKPFFDVFGGAQNFFLIGYLPINHYAKSQFLASPADSYLPHIEGCPLSAVSAWAATDSYADPLNSALPRVAKSTHELLDWPVNLPFYNKVLQPRPPGPVWISESLGAARFIDQWLDAISQRAAMVDLQTWNDFSETTLTDTNHQGISFIDLNHYFSTWYHNGSPETPTKDQLWLFYHHQLVDAEVEGRRANDPGIRNETPVTDYLEVVSLLKEPGTLELETSGVHYSIQAQAGFHDWLLIAGASMDRAMKVTVTRANRQAMPASNSYPRNSSWRTVQSIRGLNPGLPVVTLSRGGQPALTLPGRTPILGRAPLEDLGVVGSTATAP